MRKETRQWARIGRNNVDRVRSHSEQRKKNSKISTTRNHIQSGARRDWPFSSGRRWWLSRGPGALAANNVTDALKMCSTINNNTAQRGYCVRILRMENNKLRTNHYRRRRRIMTRRSLEYWNINQGPCRASVEVLVTPM